MDLFLFEDHWYILFNHKNNPEFSRIYILELIIITCRLGEPKDVSALVAFLVSDEAGYITGENFVIAGGMPSRL